jgi:hypothetical protein
MANNRPSVDDRTWLEFLTSNGLCGICGNSGIIDTTDTLHNPIGKKIVGIRSHCICPNGRAIKAANDDTVWPTSGDLTKGVRKTWGGPDD